MNSNSKTIAVVGAGPVGSLLALFLAKKGFNTEVFERRPDLRQVHQSAGRSINLALSTRGLHALNAVGLGEQVLKYAIPMRGRMIHPIQGPQVSQPYGMSDEECIFSISRSGLNRMLMSAAEQTGKVKIHFQHRVTGCDLQTATLDYEDENDSRKNSKQFSHVFGSDGSASIIRNEMMRGAGALSTAETLEYGYKELTLPANFDGSFALEKNFLHIWPRGTYMLIALPNLDGSFTCTLFLPHVGSVSFESLKNEVDVKTFFQKQFPDVYSLIPSLSQDFFEHPVGNMTTIRTSPWNVEGRILLLGDAAHAIVPFFGQGMNCGFEDCFVLSQMLNEGTDWASQFKLFFESRKPNTDAIATLASDNFLEMRDKVGNPRFLLEKEVEKILQKEFPGEYVSRYSLVTFSRVPYQFAHEVGKVEDKILSELCSHLTHPTEVDLTKASEHIRTYLTPMFQTKKDLFDEF